MRTFSAVCRILAILTIALASPTLFAAEESLRPGGILIEKSQPWHKADRASAREYASSRQYSAVIYIVDFNGKERQIRRSLVFEAHDYLPFDAEGTVEESLADQIDSELKALREIASKYQVAEKYLKPRIEKWEELRKSAPTPTPAVAESTPATPEVTGKFRGVTLPAGGALGTIALENGEEFQVWITDLTPTEIKWDEPVREGSGVYRQHSEPLAAVRSLSVYTAEDVARNELARLAPPSTSITPMAYRVMYEYYSRLLRNMRAQFDDDPRYTEWNSDLVRIREDMDQAIGTNSVKLDGRWLSDQELKANANEIAAKVLWTSAREMIALSEWNLAIAYLRDLALDHSNSPTFTENLPQLEKWIDSFGKDHATLTALARNPKLEKSVDEIRAAIKARQSADAPR